MLALPSELTQIQAAACAQGLMASIRAHADPVVVADATALERFDSSALAVLLACRRECQTQRKTFLVKGLPSKLRELAGLYGVATLLPPAP
jgi:phospholipid transport system transporter-binding protein